jgi:hypothetical protein
LNAAVWAANRFIAKSLIDTFAVEAYRLSPSARCVGGTVLRMKNRGMTLPLAMGHEVVGRLVPKAEVT